MIPPLRRKPKKKRFVKPGQRVRSPKHMAWVRKHECCAQGHACEGIIHAHHVKTRGAGGGDEWCVSLCARHHRLLHDTGRLEFISRYGVDLYTLAREFAEKSPDPKIRDAAKRAAR